MKCFTLQIFALITTYQLQHLMINRLGCSAKHRVTTVFGFYNTLKLGRQKAAVLLLERFYTGRHKMEGCVFFFSCVLSLKKTNKKKRYHDEASSVVQRANLVPLREGGVAW